MKDYIFRCVSCNSEFQAGKQYFCPKCNGILKVEYKNIAKDYQKLSQSFDYMPLEREELLSVGTNKTPLIKSERIAKEIGLSNLYFKCEFANLSGSFKDRPVSVAVAMAKKLGYKRVIAASSGNAAAATAECAARHGLESIIIVPASTPNEKVAQTAFYGAKLFKVEGPYSNSYSFAKKFSEEYDAYNVTTTFLNPYAIDGDKVVGYEICEELNDIPDYVYVPVGAGPLLVGIYRGINEYGCINKNEKKSKMVAVQAEGCCPIAKAFTTGNNEVQAEGSPKTIAGGIADGLIGYEQDGEYTLRICRESNGAVRAVDDEIIRTAQLKLAREEGIFVEPSSAAALAAIIDDSEKGYIDKNSVIIATLTGHGLKDMKSISGIVPDVPIVNSVKDIVDALYSK